MNLRRTAAHSFSWSFLIQLSFAVLNFAISIALARLLLPSDFGLIGMISIFINIGRTLVDGGLASSLIRTPNATSEDYSIVFALNLVTSVFIYLIVFLTAPFIAAFFGHEILVSLIRSMCLIFIINAFSIVQSTILNKELKFKTQFQLLLPSLIISSLVGIVMAHNGFGVWSIVWKDLSFAITGTVQLWFYSKWYPGFSTNIERYKYHFKYGYKIALSEVMNTSFNSFYNVIIGKYFSATQLGYFTRARSFENFSTSMILSAFNRVAFPLLARVKNEGVRLKSIYRRLVIIVTFFNIPILITMGVLATPLFRYLLTEKWLPAVPYFQIILLSGIFYPLFQYNLNICKVSDRSDLVLRLSLIHNFLLLLGGLGSIYYGMNFLLWSLVVINLMAVVINARFSGELINYYLREQLIDILPLLVTGGITGLLLYYIDSYYFARIFQSDFSRLFIGSLFSSITYFILSIILRIPVIQELKLIKKDILVKSTTSE